MLGSSCHLVVGRGRWQGPDPRQRARWTCRPGSHGWVAGQGETQSILWAPQNSGWYTKEAKTGVILNNNYSYYLLSTFYLLKTVQSAFYTFTLVALPAHLARMGKLKSRKVKTLAQIHTTSQWHRQESNSASSDFIANVSRNISRIRERYLLLHPFCSVTSTLTPTQPIPWTTEGDRIPCGAQPISTCCASCGSPSLYPEQLGREAFLSLGLEIVGGEKRGQWWTPPSFLLKC